MVYELSRFLYRLFFVLFFRWEVHGKENIPASGGGIIAVNHSSFLDPALVGVPVPGKIFYVAKKELFSNPLAQWYFKKLNGIPIDRFKPGAGTLKKLLRLIRDGRIVVMFPEGTRSVDGSLGEGQIGIGLLAAKARATIYPCYISGARAAMPKGGKFFRSKKIRVIYGKPVRYERLYDSPPRREVYEEISRAAMGEIEKLKSQLENPAPPGREAELVISVDS